MSTPSRTSPRGLQLTKVGLGTSQLGNLYRETSDDDAYGSIDAAWECGIRHFDTAPTTALDFPRDVWDASSLHFLATSLCSRQRSAVSSKPAPWQEGEIVKALKFPLPGSAARISAATGSVGRSKTACSGSGWVGSTWLTCTTPTSSWTTPSAPHCPRLLSSERRECFAQ